ncbi:hypothetical protein ACS0TY_022637 [Phlomoides rotata]
MRNSSFSIAEEQNVEIENINALYSKHITPINTVGSGSSVSNINITQFQDNPAVVSSLGTQHGDLAFAEHFETKNPDSFDADIVAFLQKNQNNDDLEQCVTPQEPSTSIWDADEACDAFSFQRNHSICDKGYSSSTPSSFPSHKEVEPPVSVGGKNERKLSRQDIIELGRLFQGAVSSHDCDLAESLILLAGPQTLNDALCISLDSIWFLSTYQEMCGITGIIKKIIANGAYDFTRAALRTSFLASCVSTCKSRTMSLGDTVTVMSKVFIFNHLDWTKKC